jgi:malonyl-CoA O-methyltransferase
LSGTTRKPYPEVSGYFIPTLLKWGEHDLACRFAVWLASIQNANGSWSDPDGISPYTFDTGQILKGLFAARQRMAGLDDIIRLGCDWLLSQVDRDGRVTTPDQSAWALPGGKVVPESIHLYALEPLGVAAAAFGEPKYSDACERAIAYYLRRAELLRFDTLSHFHAYIMEALVDLGHREAAIRGMEEIVRLQARDGSVPGHRNVKWVCSTGLAQYAVVWYKLGDRQRAERALRYVCSLQNASGGFFGSYGRGANYFPNAEISWAVKYFLDALWWSRPHD